MIYWQISRILKSQSIEKLVLATSTDSTDDELAQIVESYGIVVHRGDLDNVFSRFVGILDIYNPDYFLRLTADCPLVMPEIIDSMIFEYENTTSDYFSNILELTFPDGLDVEIINSKAFRSLIHLNLTKADLEHVTLGLYSNPKKYTLRNYANSENLRNRRWTVDTQEDLDFVRDIFRYFQNKELDFDFADVLSLEKHDQCLIRVLER